MLTAIFEKYVTDEVAVVVHAYLLGLAVFSTFAVAFGIVWESEGPLSVHKIAHRLVIWGVAAEVVFTITLFVFDEGISSTQKSRIDSQQSIITEEQKDIISLQKSNAALFVQAQENEAIGGRARRDAAKANEHAAQLEKDALAARSELEKLRAASSWREFDKASHEKLVSLVKSLSKPITSTILFDSVVGNPEAKHLGDLLAKALSDAIGKEIEEPRGLSSCVQCSGVWVCVNGDATPETVESGQTIRNAFEQAGVAGAKFCADPKNGIGSPSTVKVIVGPKPS